METILNDRSKKTMNAGDEERKEGKTNITIDYSLISIFDMLYLLSNNNGYLDGDAKCLIIKKG
jgi:hypothetical protein